jgi:indolepyruvate ferredoxin oxidoreductase beta subunit
LKDPFNILVAGVGGQGNLVCGKVLAEASIQQGLRPVVCDTYGASRRGGSVLTHLRVGKSDWAPLIPIGEVDILLGLEPLETLRAALELGGERTIVLSSLSKLPPTSVNAGEEEYPSLQRVIEVLEKECKKTYMFDTDTALKHFGTKQVLNAFMLGTLSATDESPFTQTTLRSAVKQTLGNDPTNIKAFDAGIQEYVRVYGKP